MTQAEDSPGRTARGLLRRAETAVLATAYADGGDTWPYGSAVLAASDCRGRPLFQLSDLAEHSRNLKATPRASLLIGPEEGPGDPLERPRVTLLGEVRPCPREEAEPRYLRRFPQAEFYKDFKDFNYYRLEVERGHLVAGFGRIAWIAGGDLVYDAESAALLSDVEGEILAHMNSDHADAVALIAGMFGGDAGGWAMTGVDPEGADLTAGDRRLRAVFDTPVFDAEGCRAELVRLTKRARAGVGREAS